MKILPLSFVNQNQKNSRNIFVSNPYQSQIYFETDKFDCRSKSQIISFGDNNGFDYEKRLKEKLEARSKFKKIFGIGKNAAKKEVELELIGYNLSQNDIIAKQNKNIELQEQIKKEKDKLIKELQVKNEMLKKQLIDAQKNNAKDAVIDDLQKQLVEIREQRLIEQQNLAKETEKLNMYKDMQAIKAKREAGKGWDKIAGYWGLKNRMEEIFINKLTQEKAGYEVEIPNAILLYGQSGTGKTRFSQAFAEEAQCDFQTIDMMQDEDDIIMDLEEKLVDARKLYKSPDNQKKRTIILLDDFNSVAQLTPEEKENLNNKNYDFEDTNVGKLSKILSNCADTYKATIFMTTNFPRKIDSKLLANNLVPHQIFLGPPMPKDAAEILQYHTKDFTNQDIDYVKLGTNISRVIEKNKAYSAQGIVNIVECAKKHCQNAQITEKDLEKAIDNVPPNIDERAFEIFLDDMLEIMTRLHSDNEAEG